MFIVKTAIKALSILQASKAHDTIKTLIHSDHFEIKEAAIDGISNIWEVPDFDFLINSSKIETNELIRKTIGFVLVGHVDETNWKSFFDNYANDSITKHREWSLIFAGNFSKDKKLIENFLYDQDGHIRKRAKKLM